MKMQTLVFVYFRGYAYSDLVTYARLNNSNMPTFPLEDEIKNLSSKDNVISVAFFDCARMLTDCHKYATK